MDIAFEILLPIDVEIETINFQQPSFEWQGEKFPQGPPEVMLYHFKLIQSTVPTYVIPMLPNEFKKENWQCIAITQGLSELCNEFLLNDENGESNNRLMELLLLLLENKKRWVIIFEPNYDCKLEVLEGSINTAFQKIQHSITRDRNGFLFWFDAAI